MKNNLVIIAMLLNRWLILGFLVLLFSHRVSAQSVDSIDSTVDFQIVSLIRNCENWALAKRVIEMKFGDKSILYLKKSKSKYFEIQISSKIENRSKWKVIEEIVNRNFPNDNNLLNQAADAYFSKQIRSELLKYKTYNEVLNAIDDQLDGKTGFLQLKIIGYYIDIAVHDSSKVNRKNFFDAVNQFAKNYKNALFSSQYNHWAFWILETSNNKLELVSAMKWAKIAYQLSPTRGDILDTYACLLYRLGKHKKAVTYGQMASELRPYDLDIRGNLEKMKSRKYRN